MKKKRAGRFIELSEKEEGEGRRFGGKGGGLSPRPPGLIILVSNAFFRGEGNEGQRYQDVLANGVALRFTGSIQNEANYWTFVGLHRTGGEASR